MAPTVPIEFSGQKQPMMGKSRKYSKGQLTGFVPDYRHAVETMGESEGLGSSGRVDMEMTASEDSCAPAKRKCISLNADSCDAFGVPMQVLQLSRMSRSERKDLEVKLNMELEQVRDLQKKIASLRSAIVLSPSSDIRSSSDGKPRPPVEAYHKPLEAPAPQVNKKRGPPGRNGARNKKSVSAQVEAGKPVTASNVQLLKQCESLLNQLWKHVYAWVFREPVDVVKLNIPDYFTVIKHPMDLGTVKSKMASGGYSNPLSFAADVRLTFSNAMTYNPPGNDVHIMADTLSKYFEQRWKAIEKKIPVTDVQSLPSRPTLHTEIIDTAAHMPPSKKKKTAPNDGSFKPVKPVKPVKPEPPKRTMSDEEKQKLTNEVDALLGELPESIIDFLKAHSGEGQTNEDEIEIDFEVLSDDTLFTLRKLVDDYLLKKEKGQAKGEPCEMEILNEPGLSNSSLHPCKGNDLVDEDVDIVGGNDAPISSFPPVEIEKDAAQRNSKCSSSRSSSSESGSSSSDSDSASSSESESRVAKASPAAGGGKEKFGSGEKSVQKRSDLGDSSNDPINGSVPVEQNSLSKPISGEEGERQEEESAPPERQVSPEKLYRAAVLINRFADTIFKAKEKALEKGDKLDPEKLRIEREELERRRKEEKARLQAEARAAEEARKKAEAEAAAVARRQRELEREAQRQALQMMEKTVDINENSRFMEGLQMFRAGDDDHLPHFIEETSPEHYQNEMGSFKLQGSCNPLERLGLFMKPDDDIELEEEEIVLPRIATESANGTEEEVEEGILRDDEIGSSDVGEVPLNDVEMGPPDDVEEGLLKDVEMGPPDDVEEGPLENVEIGPSVDGENGVSKDVERGPPEDVEEGLLEDVEMGPSVNGEDGVLKDVERGPLEDGEEGLLKDGEMGPSEDGEEGLLMDVEMGPLEDGEEGLLKDGEMGPSEDGEEGLLMDVEMGPSEDVEVGLLNNVEASADIKDDLVDDVEVGPSNNVEEGLMDAEVAHSNNAVEGFSDAVEEGPSNDVEEGLLNAVEEGPSNVVEEGLKNAEVAHSNNAAEGISEAAEEGPSNGVKLVLLNAIEEGHSNVVEDGLLNAVEEGPSDDVKECISNVVEEGPSDKVEKGPLNEVEKVPSSNVEDVLMNDGDDGPSNDYVESGLLTDFEGPSNDVGEVPAHSADTVVEGRSNDVEEGLLNDLGGPSNGIEEVPANDVDDVEEGPANDFEGPVNNVEVGPANGFGEECANDLEGPANDDVEEGVSNRAEEVEEGIAANYLENRKTDNVEEGRKID